MRSVKIEISRPNGLIRSGNGEWAILLMKERDP
jgi:hypothetical protein